MTTQTGLGFMYWYHLVLVKDGPYLWNLGAVKEQFDFVFREFYAAAVQSLGTQVQCNDLFQSV